MYLAPTAVAISIAFLHVLGEKISEHIEGYHIALLSFGSGLMVGTFFLEILPQLTVGETYLSHSIYLTFLIGFILIHVLEKLFYQHAAGKSMHARGNYDLGSFALFYND